ncbi:MAG: aspartate-semialdehyde dehydrogenase [Candidatus Calescibacterium sp.]|nr:aspartate-semialdehyde dehydrogenase [Candidatus Calescibacterium sp.]MCX7733240.1 aspartate-semialdehyde dehydrogenase [bacterium]MDW8086947.1 aspartate-semialdehyde dehydrogenase [Candidatus Calescibacterium sp.]
MYRVAVVGATGVVGREMVKTLEERNFPVKDLVLFASDRSEGEEIEFRGQKIKVRAIKENSDLNGIDIALFSAGSTVSGIFAPIFAQKGATVIDNSSRWRMDPEVPLIVPEVNPHRIKDVKKGIIANPNCSTIQLVVVLKPLHDKFKVKKVSVATYQSVSGAGKRAMDELVKQTVSYFEMKDEIPGVFPKKIAFNLIPRIGKVYDDGSTEEENKMVNETKKIMEADIKVSSMCVRVPVFISHSEAVFVELEKDFITKEIEDTLRLAKGIVVKNNTKEDDYPVPIEVAGKDEVFVGRIKKTETGELAMWIVSDNLRKGAALNAVQIAEILIGN